TVCSFDVVIDDGQTTTLVLKGVSNRIELGLRDPYIRIDLIDFRLNRFSCSLLLGVELLILRTLLDLRFALACIVLDAVEIARVAADKLLLHSLPRPLAKRFVVQRPGN